MHDYLNSILGVTLFKKFLKKIATPMEEYTVHIVNDISLTDDLICVLRQRNFKTTVHKSFPNLIVTSPRGPYKLSFLREYKEMVIDNRAAEMVYQGSDIYIPGVRRANKIKKGDIVKVVNQKKIAVAKAEAKLSHNEILNKERGIAAENLQSPFNVPSLEKDNLHKFPVYFQSIPAYLTTLNLNPQPNDRILDCCAAPGNKTIHLSELTNSKAKIIAVDRSKNRVQKIDEKIAKFKIKNISTQVGNIIHLSKQWTVKFDKILIDPPCSALGLRPRLNVETTLKDIYNYAKYQKAIFYACDKLLKKNGIVVYSTCTVSTQENEGIINYAVNNLQYKVLEQNIKLSNLGSIDESFNYNVQRFIPGIHKTVGYFIAKLEKK
ncbi:MAG: methyltransferase domain-containing protein [Candidatus Heimdallarchaeaceae archaeon]